MDFDAFFDRVDRETHRDLDLAIGRTLRALTALERNMIVALQVGLSQLDRELIGIMTDGIPASAAMDRFVRICGAAVVTDRDPALADEAKDLGKRVGVALKRRNSLAHDHVFAVGEDAETFFLSNSLRTKSVSEITVEEIESLHSEAQRLAVAVLRLAGKLLDALMRAEPIDTDRNHPSFTAYVELMKRLSPGGDS